MFNEFQVFLQTKGIISQRSCPSTPQQNGVAKRKNRHLLDVVRTLLLESFVPPHCWCEALSTAVHLINRLPSPTTNHVSPFSKLFVHSPLCSDLRTFGCVCFLHLPPHERHKFTAQSVKCVFLGYAIPHKGYVCYCHARIPIRPDWKIRTEVRGAILSILYYILYTGTLIDLFFLRVVPVPVFSFICTISVITKIILHIQKNYHRSGVHHNLYTYTESHLLIHILIHAHF